MNIYKLEQYQSYTDSDFDALLNINTSPYIETFTNHHSNRYEPTVYQDIITLVEHTYQDYTEDSFLVDFGSGLLRVPILMHHLLGLKTLGIELNKQLFLLGKENIKHYTLMHQTAEISSMNLNALDYQFTGKETHLFFFNPFSSIIFQKVMAHLMDSVIQQCDIILYYAKPEYEMYLSDLMQFKLKYSIPLAAYENDPSEKINIYEYTQIIKVGP